MKKLQIYANNPITINTNTANNGPSTTGSNLLKLNKLSPSRVLPRIHSDSDINTYQQQQQQHQQQQQQSTGNHSNQG